MKTSSLGDLSDVVQPGSIPNPVVKHVSADGTTGVALWESRSSPGELFLCGFGRGPGSEVASRECLTHVFLDLTRGRRCGILYRL